MSSMSAVIHHKQGSPVNGKVGSQKLNRVIDLKKYIEKGNKDRGNSVKCRLAEWCCHLLMTNNLFRTSEAIARFSGSYTSKSLLPLGARNLQLTCVLRPHKCNCQIASKSVEQFKQGARMWQTTDRQTTNGPHYEDMCRNRQNRLRCTK